MFRPATSARQGRILLVVSLLMVLVGGCGPSGPALHPVRGTVKVNGKPADQALVFLHRKDRASPLDPVPYGKSGADGNYQVVTPPESTGAAVGDYVITVFVPDLSQPEDGNGQRPDLLNAAYQNAGESKIAFTVQEGENTIPELDLKPGPRRAPAPSDANLK